MSLLPDSAARAVIRDLEGRELELRSLWRERTMVLVFLRHFG